MQEYRPQIDEDEYLERSVDNEAKKITNPNFTCTNPFERMAVKGNGDVLPCCSQVGYQIKLGNMKDGTLYSYWHSERMKEIRRHMLERTWSQIPTCNACLKNLVRS
jgi:radical SAM protein with 4Fe4S-binding SPASM domain